jgi:hypothetical protein
VKEKKKKESSKLSDPNSHNKQSNLKSKLQSISEDRSSDNGSHDDMSIGELQNSNIGRKPLTSENLQDQRPYYNNLLH